MGLQSKMKNWSLENKQIHNLTELSIIQTRVAWWGKCSSSLCLSSGAFSGIQISKSTMVGAISNLSEHTFWGQHLESTAVIVFSWPFTFVWTAGNMFSLKNHVKYGDTFLAAKTFLKDYSFSIFNRTKLNNGCMPESVMPKHIPCNHQLHQCGSVHRCIMKNKHLLGYKRSLPYIVYNYVFL